MTTQPKKRKRRRVSQCKKAIAGIKCPGKYLLTYEGGAPIFTCEKCGDQDLTWKKFYNEYLQLFRQKENWEVKKHKVSCILGAFCNLYKKFYGTDYVFVPQNPNPYGAKECRDALSLLATFKDDAYEVRKYLLWFFNKAIGRSTSITSFGYLTTPGIVRKYILYVEKSKYLTRASALPKDYLSWCKENIPEIFNRYELTTMNDLGALLKYVTTYSDEINSDSAEFKAISQAVKVELIKEDKLNIRS